ncbi:hypothetical protein FF124_19740 [Martelella lutilitoris]|uniref:EF-hand domain-containing protein n=1 Tax=Martelella lutilitoris TaxID=2583532 RepID=A0A5C4JNI2_9HYPH|nr:hypothetical protein [Martelella lutilitoris]TNB46139.1 hypothetical protein FF124_19740 [Martelella lutilitoris]
MTVKHLTLTALATTLAFGATAMPSIARDMRGPAPVERGYIFLLKTADADKNGKITEEEVAAFQDGRFATIDVNGDGVITPGEFADYRKAKIAEFRKTNPRPESQEKRAAMARDQDDDSRQGYKPRMAMRDDGSRRMGPDGERRRSEWNGHHRGDMQRVFFIRADSDRSGQISQEEFAALSAKMFARMDRNGDMVITVDDLPDRPMRW